MSYDTAYGSPAQAELQARLRQQAAVAALGQRALAMRHPHALLDDAATLAADAFDAEYCAVLDLPPAGLPLRLCAGTPATWSAEISSVLFAQAAYTLHCDAPVIVADLRREARFTVPPPPPEHGVISGLSVIIELHDGPFGVLCVHTSSRRLFGPHDIHFLEAMAHVLAQAIERQRAEESLRRAHDELERRVAERTRELSDANALLKQEIAERIRAEQRLNTSEARFRVIFEKAGIGIGLIDREGRIVDANPALLRILGYSADELRGAPVSRLYPPGNFLQCLAAHQSRRKEPDAACHVERWCIRKDGAKAWLDVTLSFVEEVDGQAGFAIAMVEDVTQRKATEAQMHKLSHALEQSADFVVITDREGVIEYVNPAFEEKTGYRRDEALGRTPRIVKSDAHDRGFYRRLWATLARGEVYREVFVNRTKSGELFYEEKTITPLKDGRGEITHYISTGKDITERKRAEEDARRHQAELAHMARLSTMGEMAAGLAHELNQPLSAIVNYARGCVRRMQAGKACADELLPVLDQVRAQAERAGEIIRCMRNFARKGEPRRTAVDLNAMIREVAELAEPDVRRHGATLRLALAADAPPVMADMIQIEQVILNLMLNGLEAMQTRPSGRRELLIRTESAAPDTMCITVHDTGPGLPEEADSRLFEPFFTTKPQGMGMGLSISRSIVEAHGGHLWARSESSGGASFHFTLPVADARCGTSYTPSR